MPGHKTYVILVAKTPSFKQRFAQDNELQKTLTPFWDLH